MRPRVHFINRFKAKMGFFERAKEDEQKARRRSQRATLSTFCDG